jgi:hypothetical protein
MTTTTEPVKGSELEAEITPRAAEIGFCLVQYETDMGQLVFEWRRADDPGPQFLTRHLALLWMVDWLERGDVPDR